MLEKILYAEKCDEYSVAREIAQRVANGAHFYDLHYILNLGLNEELSEEDKTRIKVNRIILAGYLTKAENIHYNYLKDTSGKYLRFDAMAKRSIKLAYSQAISELFSIPENRAKRIFNSGWKYYEQISNALAIQVKRT